MFELKSFLKYMALPFLKLEVKEKFLFIKTIISLLKKIKINKNKIQIQTLNLDDDLNSQDKDKYESLVKELEECLEQKHDYEYKSDDIKEKYKGYYNY